jgi:hypothetical protein
MTINLIPFTEDFLPSIDGATYLIKTTSTGPLKRENIFSAKVRKVFNNKKGKEICSIDVQNQIVTHISENPVL